MRRAVALLALAGCLDSPPSAVSGPGIDAAVPEFDAAPPLPPVARELIGDLLTYDCNDDNAAAITTDRSGAGRHGAMNATTAEEGRYGLARGITGAGDIVVVRDAALGPGADGLTIEAFVWLDDDAGSATIASDLLAGGDPALSFAFEIRDGAQLVLISNDGGATDSVAVAASIPLETWTHVAVTWTGEAATFYLDGAGLPEEPWAPDVVPVTDERFVHFGEASNNTALLRGRLDEIKISSYAKSAEQILASMAFDSTILAGRCGDRLLERPEVCDGQSVCCGDGCEPETSDPDCTAAGGSCRDGYCKIGSPTRAGNGLVALYEFDDSTGGVIDDESGISPSIDLTITGGTVVQQSGFIQVGENALLRSDVAVKIADRCTASNQLTVEAWVAPADAEQDGPARIASFSPDAFERNFMLGQERSLWVARVRTGSTDDNGIPMIGSAAGDAQAGRLTHVILTVADGERRLYLDGRLRTIGFMPGDFAPWLSDYPFVVGNETSADRPWGGDIHLIAIYDRALSELEVAGNFAAGPDP